MRSSRAASTPVTAVRLHERARTMPKLHKAKTVACGLLKCGKWVVTSCVH